MRSARVPLAVANLVTAIGIVATYRFDMRLDATWAYLALAGTALFLFPLWRRRRFTTLVLASAGAWSILTGVLLVYITWRLPGGGWMTWWHAVTSVAFALAFLVHWARNNARLVMLARKLVTRRAVLSAVALGWGLLTMFAVASALPSARVDVTERVAQRWADVSLLCGLVATIAAFWLVPRAADPARGRARGAVDVSLLAAMWLATVTGFALQYLGRDLRSVEAYWLTWAWHVVVSALFLALALGHAAFNARPLASHAR